MFEQELLNEISNNFSVEGFDLTIGFGEVPESTKAPYIVMFPLYNNGTRQVICDNDDYTDGRTSIQFSVYDVDYSNACYIGRQLDIFLAGLRYLENYQVLLNNSENTRGFDGLNNGISMETVTRLFTYTAKEAKEKYKYLAASDGILTVYDDLKLAVY